MSCMKDGRVLLAIETSQRGSISLFQNGHENSHWVGDREKSRSEDLLPQIENLLNKSGVNKKNIGCIAVSIGPGSFTGLRVGIALAKGLSTALNCQSIGIPLMEAMSLMRSESNLICVLNAGRGYLYRQEFSGLHKLNANSLPQLVGMEEFSLALRNHPERSLLVEKDFLDKESLYFDEIGQHVTIREAPLNIAGLIGRAALAKPEISTGQEIVPLYIRNADAKLPVP